MLYDDPNINNVNINDFNTGDLNINNLNINNADIDDFIINDSGIINTIRSYNTLGILRSIINYLYLSLYKFIYLSIKYL